MGAPSIPYQSQKVEDEAIDTDASDAHANGRFFRLDFIIAALGFAAILEISASALRQSFPPSLALESALVTSSVQPAQQSNPTCNESLLGAWVETCFIVDVSAEDPEELFPGLQGVVSYPIIVTTSQNGGFDLYGYADQEPFFGGENYWEVGKGFPSRVISSSATRNCAARFKSRLRVGLSSDWTEDDQEYYWNPLSKDKMFTGNGKGAACYFERLDQAKCIEARSLILLQFQKLDMDITLPSQRDLCGI